MKRSEIHRRSGVLLMLFGILSVITGIALWLTSPAPGELKHEGVVLMLASCFGYFVTAIVFNASRPPIGDKNLNRFDSQVGRNTLA